MFKKIMILVLSLAFIPLMQGCEDGDVAAGAVVGAVVGGSIVAIANDNNGYHGRDRYYRSRYNNYYGPRRGYYRNNYRGRYQNRNYSRVSIGYRQRLGGYRYNNALNANEMRAFASDVQPMALATGSADVKALSSFFQLPPPVAAIMADVKNRARNGDLSGLYAINLTKGDFRDLANDQRLSSSAITLMGASLGIDRDHAESILEDFRSEFKAQVAVGRIKI